MNLKLLIFGVFTAWIVLCTKWYVCEIQHSCYEDNPVETVSRPASEPVTRQLAVASDPAVVKPVPSVSKAEEKKPEVIKSQPKTVKIANKTAVPEKKKPVKTDRQGKVVKAEPVAKSSNLTAKGGLSGTVTAKSPTSKSTRQILVETGRNKLTVCYPQQYTEKSVRSATDNYLSDLVKQWKKTGGKIYVTGHTDFVGSADANYEVGMERAQNIRDILRSKGVPASRITCTSEGEDLPRASNDTPLGRFQNRRVEVVIKK